MNSFAVDIYTKSGKLIYFKMDAETKYDVIDFVYMDEPLMILDTADGSTTVVHRDNIDSCTFIEIHEDN